MSSMSHPFIKPLPINEFLRAPVKTELALGLSSRAREPEDKNADPFKKLYNRLIERVRWQPNAATSVANAITKAKPGRENHTKSNRWLLFSGPDTIGKRRMAMALSELMFNASPITLSLCTDNEATEYNTRGRSSSLDWLVETLRMNPFRVVVIEGVDRADRVALGRIKRARSTGRLVDSNGREASLSGAIFILISDCNNNVDPSVVQLEERMLKLVDSSCDLELKVENERIRKHKADWNCEESHIVKKAKIDFDLNLIPGAEELEEAWPKLAIKPSAGAVGLEPELVQSVDESILFELVDFEALRTRVLEAINAEFDAIMGDLSTIRVDEDALERIIAGIWLKKGDNEIEQWIQRVFSSSLKELKSSMNRGSEAVSVRLSKGNCGRGGGDLMPEVMTVDVEGISER